MNRSQKIIAALGLAALIIIMVLALQATPGPHPALERGPTPEARPAPKAHPANFLWEVTSERGGRAYILGSIHLAYPGLYPLNNEITAAFDRSEALVVEINTEEMPQELIDDYIQKHGYTNDGWPLPERLSPETRVILEKSGFYNPGLALFKPWLAALAVQLTALQKNGFEARYGLDRHFIEKAQTRKIKIIELETIDDQMGLLANMSQEEADLFLRSAILEMDDLPVLMEGFLDTWRQGDVEGFGEIFFKEYDRYPELTPLMDKVIFRRNERMAAKIHELLLEPGVLFVVIGAGHLVSDRSVLTELADRGHTVRQQ